MDARATAAKRQLARARCGECRLGYQVEFPTGPSCERLLRECRSSVAGVVEILARKGRVARIGSCRLLPLKYSGAACAKYFTKYLTKALPSEKLSGDEKCRLFGVWGDVRFVHSRFTFLSSRIAQKRKQWLAEELGLDHAGQLPGMLGHHWWFHFGAMLCEVVMPEDFYKVGPQYDLQWDTLGSNVYARDCAAWPGVPSDDLMDRSQFNLFRAIGDRLFGPRSGEAIQFAMNRLARPEPEALAPVDAQLILNVTAGIDRRAKSCSP